MKNFESNGNHFTIKVIKAPLFIRILLWTVLIFSILTPLLSIGYNIYIGNGLKAWYFITLLFSAGISYYTYRIVAWNSFGKEQFEATSTELTYYADYKIFTQAEKKIPLNQVELKYIKTGYVDEDKGVIQFQASEPTFSSSIRLPKDQILEIISELKRNHKL